MRHCRKDYNQRVQDAAGIIPDTEPVFLLRGQDKYAYKIVKIYADMLAADAGVPTDMVEAVRQHASQMYDWQSSRGKTPDCPAPLLIKV